MIDFIHSVLDEYDSSHSHTQIQRPSQQIVNRDTGASRAVKSDVPDLVSVHGTLQASSIVNKGASLLATLQTGPPFPGTKALTWTITGEKGRVRMSIQHTAFVQTEGNTQAIPIELPDFSTGEVKQLAWEWEDWQEPVAARGRNIAKLYDLYYEGKAEEYGLCDFEGAVRRHAQIDGMLY